MIAAAGLVDRLLLAVSPPSYARAHTTPLPLPPRPPLLLPRRADLTCAELAADPEARAALIRRLAEL